MLSEDQPALGLNSFMKVQFSAKTTTLMPTFAITLAVASI